MIQRRTLLRAVGATGTVVALAGCSEQNNDEAVDDPEPEPEAEAEADTEVESEAEPDSDQEEGLQGLVVEDITLTYNFSSGLQTEIALRNETGLETASVHISVEAYSGDQLVDDASQWEDFSAGYLSDIELTLSSIGALEDHDIDDITEFVVSGRLEGEETVEIERLDGDTLRERVDE